MGSCLAARPKAIGSCWRQDPTLMGSVRGRTNFDKSCCGGLNKRNGKKKKKSNMSVALELDPIVGPNTNGSC